MLTGDTMAADAIRPDGHSELIAHLDTPPFENAAHDFPQRIIYRKTAGGLHARIEGLDKGKPRSEDFPYKRVSCD